jgi:hypothetical protein
MFIYKLTPSRFAFAALQFGKGFYNILVKSQKNSEIIWAKNIVLILHKDEDKDIH